MLIIVVYSDIDFLTQWRIIRSLQLFLKSKFEEKKEKKIITTPFIYYVYRMKLNTFELLNLLVRPLISSQT